MARSCVTDPRWRELVALYRYDWIAAADVLFGKTPTWQQDLGFRGHFCDNTR